MAGITFGATWSHVADALAQRRFNQGYGPNYIRRELSMKKIALCISGQPRFVEKGYEEVLKPFVLDGNDVDVFIHSWIPDEDQIGKPYINAGGHITLKNIFILYYENN